MRDAVAAAAEIHGAIDETLFDLKRARFPTFSSLPSRFCLDHSHCPVLAPATLAALPSTRAIKTRSLPSSLAATHRGFAFYVADPLSSIRRMIG